MRLFQKDRGFTLLELMMVIAVLGVIASIALPSYMAYTQRSKMAEAVLLLNDLTRREIEFFLRPRTAANGDPLNACYLLAARSPDFPSPLKKPFVTNANYSTLGFYVSGPTYFSFEVYGFGMWDEGACTTPNHVTFATWPDTDYAFAAVFADLDGDRLWNILGRIFGAEASYAMLAPAQGPSDPPPGHTLNTHLERGLGTQETNGQAPRLKNSMTIEFTNLVP